MSKKAISTQNIFDESEASDTAKKHAANNHGELAEVMALCSDESIPNGATATLAAMLESYANAVLRAFYREVYSRAQEDYSGIGNPYDEAMKAVLKERGIEDEIQ